MKELNLAWPGLFGTLDRRSPALQPEIRRRLVQAIENRQLQPQARLPSSRQLAEILGVARITVLNVYRQLVEEGYLLSRERSGVFVAPLEATVAVPTKTAPDAGQWDRRFAVRPGRLLNIEKPRDWQRYAYPFLFGQLDPALFPTAPWREAVKDASSVTAIQAWSADAIDDDDPMLIEQLCRQVLPRRGIWATADEVMITLGAQQALYLIIRLLVGPRSVVGVEEPGYPDMRHMASLHAGSLQRLAVDDEGAVPDAAMASCTLALLTPGHQCPTTVTMPLARRKAALELARARDIVLVEDDYDADLLSEGDAIPSLKSLDADGRVIYVGSLSKVLAPGLRLGFTVAPPPVIRELRALRRLILRHPPSNNQRAMAGFIALGHYRGHLRRVATALAGRAELLDALLPRHLPACRWQRAAGASSFWAVGPPDLDARALVSAARARGVLIEPGDVFFDDSEAGRHCFRLGFSAIRIERIMAGVTELSKAWADLLEPCSEIRNKGQHLVSER